MPPGRPRAVAGRTGPATRSQAVQGTTYPVEQGRPVGRARAALISASVRASSCIDRAGAAKSLQVLVGLHELPGQDSVALVICCSCSSGSRSSLVTAILKTGEELWMGPTAN